MRAKHTIAAAFTAAALLSSPALAAPDIVIFLADDLSSTDAGPVARAAGAATPAIDSIAKGGITFTSGYAQPACVQARAALLSGKWPQRKSVGAVLNNGPFMASSVDTIAEKLRRLGYTTALFGKWHEGLTTGRHPNDQGFHHFVGFKGITPDYVGHDPDAPLYRQRNVSRNAGAVMDNLATEAAAFLRAQRDNPAFVFVSWIGVHDPLQGKTLGQRLVEMDNATAKVLAAVKPETLILYGGDNGRATGSNKPFRGGKFEILEGGVRVPLYLRWDGHVSPGRVVDTPASLIDFAATSVAAAGGSVGATDGHNLLNLSSNRLVCFQGYSGDPGFACRRGPWKLLEGYNGIGTALFNVVSDKGEARNVAGANPAIVADLHAAIAGFKSALQN